MLICKRCYNRIESQVCNLVIVPGACHICGSVPACNYNNVTRRTELFLALVKMSENSPIIDMNVLAFLGGNMSFESFLLSVISHQNQVIAQMAIDLESSKQADEWVDNHPLALPPFAKPAPVVKKTWSRRKKTK